MLLIFTLFDNGNMEVIVLRFMSYMRVADAANDVILT